jgi:hypothetical protein
MEKEDKTNKKEEIKGNEIFSFNIWLLLNFVYCKKNINLI